VLLAVAVEEQIIPFLEVDVVTHNSLRTAQMVMSAY